MPEPSEKKGLQQMEPRRDLNRLSEPLQNPDGCLGEVGAADVLSEVRTTRVVLATAYRNHDTADNSPSSLAAFCQRCHILHDQPEHQRRRWRTLFRRKALGDLFRGPYG